MSLTNCMMPHYMGPSNSLVVRIKCLKMSFLVRDIVQVIQVVSNGYQFVLGLGLGQTFCQEHCPGHIGGLGLGLGADTLSGTLSRSYMLPVRKV